MKFAGFSRMSPDADEIIRAGSKANSKWYIRRIMSPGTSPSLQPVDWRGQAFSWFTLALFVIWTIMLYGQYVTNIKYIVLGYMIIGFGTLAIAAYKTFPK